MALVGPPPAGPFRGCMPFDEAAAGAFFGRTADLVALVDLVTRDSGRATALFGESGVGKTSLLRAGVVPTLAQAGIPALYIGAYDDLEPEIVQGASRVRLEPPGSGEDPAGYLARLARAAGTGIVVILDHLERLLNAQANPLWTELVTILARASAAAGSKLRLLVCVETSAFPRLDQLARAVPALAPPPGSWFELRRFSALQVEQVIEHTALQTGTFIEAGLARVMAADLCEQGQALPLDVQILGRTVLDHRLLSTRRYEKSGGAAFLIPHFFDRIVREAGRRAGLRVLLFVADHDGCSADDVAQGSGLFRSDVDHALSTFVARGLIARAEGGRPERFGLAHPALVTRIAAFAATARARRAEVLRVLRRHALAGERLSPLEIAKVRRGAQGPLSPDDEANVKRSTRRAVFQASLALLIASGLFIMLFFDMRSSYSLALSPAAGLGASVPAGSRVVVRMGRADRPWLTFLPSHPAFGAVIADTGFSARGLSDELQARITSRQAFGKLDRSDQAVPSWLRAILAGVRPVPRGVAAALLGEPTGIISLKQAFTDPAARRETLDALAVIGRGRAGEDEILATALGDAGTDVRRRGVEVAAAIDRRLGDASHATTLRNALSDPSLDVREAVLREASSLPAAEQANLLAVALTDADPGFRRLAQTDLLALSERAPAAAAQAAQSGARSPDAAQRKSALLIFEQIVARGDAGFAARALAALVADETTPEETRVQALILLRKTDAPDPGLTAIIRKAVAPEASPRLRAAALPLYARLIDLDAAEALATSESHGPAAARAAGAAVWGTIAMQKPDSAAKALKGFVYDPATEVRIEAARSCGFLRREGPALVQKLLLDGNPDVQKAAIDAAVQLAGGNPYAIAEMLGKAMRNVRPGVRRAIAEALGRIGENKPGAAVPALARAAKESDPATRESVALALCRIARKSAQTVSPFLRMAAHDEDRDVRAAAASCLDAVGQGDPKGAARMASELADAKEPSVRAAAALALTTLAGNARDVAWPALLKLAEDSDRQVRTTALQALGRQAEATAAPGKRTDDLERVLAGQVAHGDRDDRRLALEVAGRHHLSSILRTAAHDPDESLRLEAVRAAGAMKPADLDLIRTATDDPSTSVRALAIQLLVNVTGSAFSNVVPVFETMLRTGDDQTRQAAAHALGDLVGAEVQAAALLSQAADQSSEAVRAAAAAALGRVALRRSDLAEAPLALALRDPANDVRAAAGQGLAAVWAGARSPDALATTLVESETDSARRFVALEALVIQGQATKNQANVTRALDRAAAAGAPLARLAAEVGRAFMGGSPAAMRAFLARLNGA